MKKNNTKSFCLAAFQLKGIGFAFILLSIILNSCGSSNSESNDASGKIKDSSQTFIQKVISKVSPKKKIEHCEFDMKQQTSDFLKDKPQFANYKWNNQQKEAVLLLDGKDTLTIHHGGCHYFEFSINLKTVTKDNSIDDSVFWFNTALSYAKDLFDKGDYELMKKDIETHEYDITKGEDVKFYSFPHEKYDEFYIRISFEHKAKEVEVGYSYSANTKN